jgi:hypothetical protein
LAKQPFLSRYLFLDIPSWDEALKRTVVVAEFGNVNAFKLDDA